MRLPNFSSQPPPTQEKYPKLGITYPTTPTRNSKPPKPTLLSIFHFQNSPRHLHPICRNNANATTGAPSFSPASPPTALPVITPCIRLWHGKCGRKLYQESTSVLQHPTVKGYSLFTPQAMVPSESKDKQALFYFIWWAQCPGKCGCRLQ